MNNIRIFIIATVLVLIAAACSTVVLPVKVEGTAMLPALKDGDRIIIDRNPQEFARGDIIIFYFPLDPDKSYIKRIVGLPHETVEIRAGKVLINGKFIEELYVDPRNSLSARSLAEIEMPADSYFVMGDNRDNSADSRLWGPLHKKFIYGKYIKKYL